MSLCHRVHSILIRAVPRILAVLTWLAGIGFGGEFSASLSAAASPREQLSLDQNWRFHLGDIPLNSFPGGQGVALYGPDFTHSGAKAGSVWGAAARGYDDRNWRQVNLPHDWAVEQVFDPKAEKQQGYRSRVRSSHKPVS